MLRVFWTWAIVRKKVKSEVNPFENPKGLNRKKRNKQAKRDMYSPEEVGKMLSEFPRDDRLGCVFRLSLITGCRATELCKVLLSDIADDLSHFFIPDGKTDNAVRIIPVPLFARDLFELRVAKARELHQQHGDAAAEWRLFPDYPLRPTTGKASSLSQQMTRERRRVLGMETDGQLTFHSLRHTWFTIARRAGVPAGDANDLGGWAGERTSSSSYDHGLLLQDLSKRQEEVATRVLVPT